MNTTEILAWAGFGVTIIGAVVTGIIKIMGELKELKLGMAENTVTTNATAIEMAVVKAQTDGIGKQLEDAARAKGDLQGRAAQTAEQNAATVAAIPPVQVTSTPEPTDVKIVNTPSEAVPVEPVPAVDDRQVSSKSIPNGK